MRTLPLEKATCHLPPATPTDPPLPIPAMTNAAFCKISKMKFLFLTLSLISLLFISGCCDESPPEGSLTIVLNEDNFDDLVTNNEFPWMVLFYAPWCGHCKKVKPDWFKLGEALVDHAGVGMVDCTTNKPLCGKFRVKGYPTIKFLDPETGVHAYNS